MEEKKKIADEVEELHEVRPEEKVIKGEEGNLISKEVEENRNALYSFFRKQKNMNRILLFISIIAVVGVYLLFSKQFTTAVIISVVILLGVAGYTYYAKKKLTVMTDVYIGNYFNLMTKYIFDNPLITEVSNDYHEKMTKEEIEKSRVVKDIVSIGCRNVTKGKISGNDFSMCDVAIKINVEKKPALAFIGKYFVIEAPKEIKGRAIVYLRSKVDSVGPTDIDELEKINSFDIKNSLVLATKDANLTSFLSRKNIKILNSVVPNEILTDMTLSFVDGKIHVLISYEDSLMIVPMQEEFTDNAFRQAKSDIGKIADFIANLTASGKE